MTRIQPGLDGPPVASVDTISATTGTAANGPSHTSVLSYVWLPRTASTTRTVTTTAVTVWIAAASTATSLSDGVSARASAQLSAANSPPSATRRPQWTHRVSTPLRRV